jgi:nicotinamide-nucleotide amidase
MDMTEDLGRAAERVASLLDGRTLACAESCTAGLLAQAFASVDGSGDWFRGGIVAYQRSTKVHLLSVDPTAPLVSATVAEEMARAVARDMHADVAVATTGAAGPTSLDGAPPGTVVVALLCGSYVGTQEFRYDDVEPDEVVERAAADAAHALAGLLAVNAAIDALSDTA